MNSTYHLKKAASSIFMILALVWLTVSLPFVYAAQQKAIVQKSQMTERSDDDRSANPFGNTTEEKAPSGGVNSLSEEYLHHTEELFHAAELFLSHHCGHSVSEYQAFHGELLCPPPNFIG